MLAVLPDSNLRVELYRLLLHACSGDGDKGNVSSHLQIVSASCMFRNAGFL